MNKFECDKDKARTNYAKHGVRFTEACRSISLGYSLTARSPQSDQLNEERNTSIAKLPDGRAVVVIWTPRGNNVRIISVRRARKKEKEALNAYLQNLQ